MRTVTIDVAKFEISCFHASGHRINDYSPGWQTVKFKGRRDRIKDEPVKTQTEAKRKINPTGVLKKRCYYDGVEYCSINECIRQTGIKYQTLLKDPLFSKHETKIISFVVDSSDSSDSGVCYRN